MKIGLKFKNKKINFDVEVCKWKFLGLMFSRREKAKALLFDFKKSRRVKIHSFFCPKFLAVWLDDKNKIIEIQKILPWRFHILPKKKFWKLVEIPCNGRYEDILHCLVGDAKSLKSKIS